MYSVQIADNFWGDWKEEVLTERIDSALKWAEMRFNDGKEAEIWDDINLIWKNGANVPHFKSLFMDSFNLLEVK